MIAKMHIIVVLALAAFAQAATQARTLSTSHAQAIKHVSYGSEHDHHSSMKSITQRNASGGFLSRRTDGGHQAADHAPRIAGATSLVLDSSHGAPCQCQPSSPSWVTPPSHPPKCIFIDLGANDGESYRVFLGQSSVMTVEYDTKGFSHVDCDAYLVEANPHYRAALETLRSDHVHPLVQVASYMCDKQDEIFHVANNAAGSSLNASHSDSAQSVPVQVEMQNLMRFLTEVARPEDHVIVKMDIEGAEYDIIPCLARSPAAKLVDALYVEDHCPPHGTAAWDPKWCPSTGSAGTTRPEFQAAMQTLRDAGMYVPQGYDSPMMIQQQTFRHSFRHEDVHARVAPYTGILDKLKNSDIRFLPEQESAGKSLAGKSTDKRPAVHGKKTAQEPKNNVAKMDKPVLDVMNTEYSIIRKKPTRIAVASQCGGDFYKCGHGSFTKVFENHRDYAKEHGYEYFLLEKRLSSRPAVWDRFPLVTLLHNRGAEWVLYLDADAMFMNTSVKIEDFIEKNGAGKDLIVSGDLNVHYQAGVYLIRKSLWTHRSLCKAWRICPSREWAELGAMMTVLGGGNPNDSSTWTPAFQKMNGSGTTSSEQSAVLQLLPAETKEHAALLPQRAMNSYSFGSADDMARMFPGMIEHPDQNHGMKYQLQRHFMEYQVGDWIVHFAGFVDKQALVKQFSTQVQPPSFLAHPQDCRNDLLVPLSVFDCSDVQL